MEKPNRGGGKMKEYRGKGFWAWTWKVQERKLWTLYKKARKGIYHLVHEVQEITDEEELKELLEYEWSMHMFRTLQKKGVKIEVYLGGKDKIIDAKGAYDFFLDVATVTYIKDANHFLQLH